MRGYRVEGGVVTIGIGEAVGMSAAEYKRRVHNVDVIKADARTGAVIVRGRVPLQFKVGEEIALKELPKRLVGLLAPLDKPKSEAEEIAALHPAPQNRGWPPRPRLGESDGCRICRRPPGVSLCG